MPTRSAKHEASLSSGGACFTDSPFVAFGLWGWVGGWGAGGCGRLQGPRGCGAGGGGGGLEPQVFTYKWASKQHTVLIRCDEIYHIEIVFSILKFNMICALIFVRTFTSIIKFQFC